MTAGPRLAVVLWNGNLGGAETLNAALAEHMQRCGAHVTVVFVQDGRPLASRLEASGIDHVCVGLPRGRSVLRHGRRYATSVADAGPDGALLLECGFMGWALRLGGYQGPIVAVEHGALLGLGRFSMPKRLFWRADRLGGAWANDAEVAVSDFMAETMRAHPHAHHICRIYNGVDPAVYGPVSAAEEEPATGNRDRVRVGFAGRLIPGKGADSLIQALALAGDGCQLELLIAGDGPERRRLTSLAHSLQVASSVRFCGRVENMVDFWRECDVAAVPSDTFIESFSMTTLEAMASALPTIASRNGAIPELVLDGVTGTLVEPGDIGGFARAMVQYAENAALRGEHGQAARARAVDRFHIESCARSYLELFGKLAVTR